MSRPGRVFDGLMVRVMAVQVFVIVMVFSIMILAVAQYRGAASARMIAPLWADALRMAEPGDRPDLRRVSTEIRLLPGPPPSASRKAAAFRYGVLQEEMAARGVVVEQIRLSGPARQPVTWLQVRLEHASKWVGIQGSVFGPGATGLTDALPRGGMVLIALTLVVVSSWWLSHTVVRPIRQLERGMQQFFNRTGEVPELPERGPAEVRSLSRSFLQMAHAQSALDADRALMLTSISHDLRSPLARIRLAAELIPAGGPDASTREAIKRNVDIADRHLESFLGFAMPPQLTDAQEFDMQALLESAVQDAVPDPSRVHLKVGSGAASVHGNPVLLRRIAVTALDNAVKHGEPPFLVRASRSGQFIVFEVEDHGRGLPPQDRQRVLRPFERGQQARTTPGTGLGLAIALQIAQRMGGQVELTQAAGGLIFRCTFPVDSQQRIPRFAKFIPD